MARIPLTAHPGSAGESVEWDPWRKRWSVHVREPAVGGRANRAILRTLADRLGVVPSAVRWIRAGSGSIKLAEVDGLSDAEVAARLSTVRDGRRPPSA